VSKGHHGALDYITKRLASYLEEQVGKFFYLRGQKEIPLTNGQTPDIVL